MALPERPASEVPAQSSTLHGNVHVTFHDMLAANYAERALTLSGIDDKYVSIFTVARDAEPIAYITENLVLICSPKANPYTRSVLKLLPMRFEGIRLSFEAVSLQSGERWKVCYNGADYVSPSYSEAEQLAAQGGSDVQGPLSDFAVLGRFQNPWQECSKIVLIAGIRGIGTWGAARYLRDHTKSLSKRFGGKDFVCIIRSEYSNFRIVHTEFVGGQLLVPRASAA